MSDSPELKHFDGLKTPFSYRLHEWSWLVLLTVQDLGIKQGLRSQLLYNSNPLLQLSRLAQ